MSYAADTDDQEQASQADEIDREQDAERRFQARQRFSRDRDEWKHEAAQQQRLK